MQRLLLGIFLISTLFFSAAQALAAGELSLTGTSTYNSLTGQITYAFNWSVATGTLASNVTLTATNPSGTTFASVGSGGTLESGQPVWRFFDKQGPAFGTAEFMVSLDSAQTLQMWAHSVERFTPGSLYASTTLVSDSPNELWKAIGAADNAALSLGFSSSSSPAQLVLHFPGLVYNGQGNDIKIYANSNNEKVLVEAGNDNSAWVQLGTLLGTGELDLGSLASARYIRLTDATDQSTVASSSFGYLLDAVKSLHLFPLSCNIVTFATLSGTVGGGLVTVPAAVRFDIVPNCGGSGHSGLSGLSGISGSEFSPGSPTPGSATATPASAPPGSSPGSNSGTSVNFSGPSGPPQSGSSEPAMPEGAGGAEPQVLGDSVSLPRTGQPLMNFFLLPFVFLIPILFRRGSSH